MGPAWIALVVAVTAGSADTRSKVPFLPAIDFASRSVEEWRSELARSGGRSREALWSLFYHDDRGDETVAELRRWQRDARTVEARRELEVVLNHWSLPVDAPLPLPGLRERADVPAGHLALPSEPYETPFPRFADLDQRALLERLDGDDPMTRARAALTLVHAGRDVGRVVRTLSSALFAETAGTWCGSPYVRNDRIPEHDVTGSALLWCIDHAGSSADEALLELLLDPEVDEARRPAELGVLRQVGPSSAASPAVVTDGLVVLAERPGRTGVLACRWALRVADVAYTSSFQTDFGFEWSWSEVPDSWWMREPLGSPPAEEMLARVVGAFLRGRRARGTGTAEDLAAALVAGLRSGVAARVLVPEVLPWLEREDAVGEAALFVVCALGASASDVRARYVEALRRIDPDDPSARIPRLRHHDGETLAALEAAFDAAGDKAPFFDPLLAAGLLDVPWSRVGREAVRSARRATSPWSRWYGWFACGVRGVPEVAPTDPAYEQVEMLAIAIRTLREYGRDASAPQDALERLVMEAPPERGNGSFVGAVPRRIEALGIASRTFIDWSIDYVCDPERYHHREFGRMLQRFALDRRQQARLCHFDSIWGLGDHLALFAARGEASIERVGEIRGLVRPHRSWRNGVVRHRLEVLDAILSITKATPAELGVLRRALDDGDAAHRREAVELVARHGVTAPSIVDAVRRRSVDLDAGVRRAAEGALLVLER